MVSIIEYVVIAYILYAVAVGTAFTMWDYILMVGFFLFSGTSWYGRHLATRGILKEEVKQLWVMDVLGMILGLAFIIARLVV
ncbi:MAG: hypothetical protein D6769_01700 [Methanobacteriota archaeon]|nr:MAG: hypothetical protein D6769_01700 [Euryarchaeota archaeon]